MSEAQSNGRLPTVSHVGSDTLIELVYDEPLRKTALAVSRFGGLWNIEQESRIATGQTLVPYSASNNLIANSCVLLPSGPVEYGSKQELLADIRAFLHRYVDLSPVFEQIAAHYVLLTWVYDRFYELPYLRLRGEYGTGKTRALTAIGSLCYKPFFASGASTVSPIFHTLDAFRGTLILDEADLPFSDARVQLVKIFNNGTVQGMPVLRSVQDGRKEFNPRAFKVFGPKVIAMREGFHDPALESRFLTENTGFRSLRADIPIQTPTSLKAEAQILRNRLLHFRFSEYFKINPNPNAIVPGIEPRLNQIALPLLSLVEDPVLRGDIYGLLIRQNVAITQARQDSDEAHIVAATLAAFLRKKGKDVSVGEIAVLFNEANYADQGRSPKWVGNLLRNKIGISIRRFGGLYVVPLAEKPKIEALAGRFGVTIPVSSGNPAST